MRREYRVSVVSALAVLLFVSLSFGFVIDMSPPRIVLETEQGETQKAIVSLRNKGDQTITVRAYTEDWYYNDAHSRIFAPAGTTDHSCARWITISPDVFPIAPGKSVDIECLIDTPHDAVGGHVAVVFFEMDVGDIRQENMAISYGARIGCMVYHRTKGTTIVSAEVKGMETTEPDDNKPLKITVTMQNTGNSYIRGQGDVSIIDSLGGIYGKTKMQGINCLPGNTIQPKAEWVGGLPEGDYDIIATLDIETDIPLVVEKSITVVNDIGLGTLLYEETEDGPAAVLEIINKGNITFEGTGTITGFDSGGAQLFQEEFDISGIYPHDSDTVEIPLPTALNDIHTCTVEVPFDNEILTVKQTVQGVSGG